MNWTVYQKSERTELGTVSALVGAKGSVELIHRNLRDLSKSVALVLVNARKESTVVPCSKAVSELIRSKVVTIGQVIKFFPVIEFISNKVNAEGKKDIITMIVSPSTDGVPNTIVKVESLKNVPAYSAVAKPQPEITEFVAF